MPGRAELGRVARAHGTGGALVVVLHGDDPVNLIDADEVTLEGAPGSIPFVVRHASEAGHERDGRVRVRLELAGLDDRSAAEPWAGATVSVPEDALAALSEGEHYWRDLIGLACVTEQGVELGRIEEIWPTAGHDVLVVRAAGRQILLPAVDPVVLRVDLDAGQVIVAPPEGTL